jgi:hypothetical protein
MCRKVCSVRVGKRDVEREKGKTRHKLKVLVKKRLTQEVEEREKERKNAFKENPPSHTAVILQTNQSIKQIDQPTKQSN